MRNNDYDVVIQVQKGLIMKNNDFINQLHLFVAKDKLYVIDVLSTMMLEGVVLAIDPRAQSSDGNFYTIKCSKFISLEKVVKQVTEYFKENNIRWNKE